MTKFNFVEDACALMFVRQFHRKRIARFLKNKPFHEVENIADLERSKSMVIELNKIIQ